MSSSGHLDDPGTSRIRIAIPGHLRALAKVDGEVVVKVAEPATLGAALDALEAAHPTLAGTVRDRDSRRRRPMIRLYADGDDLSDASPDTPLPVALADGREPLRVVGSIAGG